MKLMCPKKRIAVIAALFILPISFSTILTAQTRKPTQTKKPTTASKKADVKKTSAKSKDARKDPRTAAKAKASPSNKKASAKNTRNAKNRRPSKQTNSRSAKNDPKQKKLSKAEQAKLDAKNNKNKKKSKKELEAERRAEAKRRKEEAARRAAALAEQRRREEAARIARERKLAFERGLRNETQANILKDNPEGEDLRIRQVAIDALGSRAGTVVVMESQTGKILTMVNQDWAIRNSFKPCSTIKLVTGVAGINENVINNEGTVVGDGSSMRLNTALAYSKNPYFQRVGVKMGNGKMIEYAKDLGLGQKTGINAEGETPGRLPYGNNNPRIYSHGDDFEVTPLQLAVMVSAIANDGKKVVPQVYRPQAQRTGFRPQLVGRIELPQDKVEGVLPGMIGAAEYGTARRGVDPSLGIAGKTGSCIGKGSWVGLFASVAPVENPKYSVVVITRGEGERGKFAAGVAHRIYSALAPQISRDQTKFMAIKSRTFGPPIDDSAAAVEDDEEDDDVATELLNDTGSPVIVAGSAQRQVQPEPKKVVKTAQSKPVFAPVVIPYKKDATPTDPAQKQRPRIVKNEK